MNHGISIRPSKDIRTNYAQISALTRQNPVAITVNGKEDTVLLSHEEYQEQLLRISELEAKLSMYAHLAQAMDDIRLGRVQSADAVFDELLGELEAPQDAGRVHRDGEKRSPGDRRSSCKTVRQPGACRPLCPGAAGADGDPGAVPGIRRIPAGPDAEEQRLPFSDAQGLSAVLPVRKGRGSGLYHGHFPRQARLPARHAAISVT